MLGGDDIQRLRRLVNLAPYMDKEMQEKLLRLIRDLKAAEASGSIFPQSAVDEMTKAVPDRFE
jgi:hypothetical protein